MPWEYAIAVQSVPFYFGFIKYEWFERFELFRAWHTWRREAVIFVELLIAFVIFV